ncbi:MAG TPA: glycosyltransferase family 2 protein [Burkholderiales bacterium]|jgi:dolichol-phosphate mannosyltransferase/undecaprenyl-phosphate 4-deoxy-4-formamido-L-arabinose transferase
MRPLGPDYSVVVPVYNAEASLEELVRRVGAVFRELGRSHEIVLVDDGSKDGSWALIERLRAAGAPIRAFQFARNHGQHYALKCGLDHCSGRYAITMDDDLQHPPEEIAKLVRAIEEDPAVDVVTGHYHQKEHPALRNLGAAALHRIHHAIFRTDQRISISAFRVMRRSVIDEIRHARHAQPRIGPIILSITSRIKSVPVRHEPRRHGRSGYTLRRLVGDTLSSIMNYSALPLRVVSVVGLGASFIAVVLACVYLWVYFSRGIGVSGFATLVLLILFTSGAVLFSFGLVGEYLRRIVAQQLMFSQYHVRAELPAEEPDPSRR